MTPCHIREFKIAGTWIYYCIVLMMLCFEACNSMNKQIQNRADFSLNYGIYGFLLRLMDSNKCLKYKTLAQNLFVKNID